MRHSSLSAGEVCEGRLPTVAVEEHLWVNVTSCLVMGRETLEHCSLEHHSNVLDVGQPIE